MSDTEILHEVMQKGKFDESEYTVVSKAQRLEYKAKNMLSHMLCTLEVNGQRRKARIQHTHFKFLGWPTWRDMPNFEVDVKGINSGRILRVDMIKSKMIISERQT